ncbi:hypothetical protein [Acetobacterium woodii]|uniref:Putative membrane protein n=1 Tax=Acetobacterium woodii (strain ATCC 29683 / DSM 1030 / JCM 2381 / KCTC 1655 / WB1) TaxID=931626 RepID=H6LGC8_ACEWD|nr:hypothetical protein [Acetobacterium woodii]AFA47064.1 putative membrane protein [Acetobacterium woodii DSM 1030]
MAIKQKLEKVFLVVKTKVSENKLRTGAFFCMLLVLIGFFMPFVSAKAEVSVTGIMNNTISVVSPNYDIVNFNLGDFVLQKPIDEVKIYGVALGDVKIFDQSVLTMLRNPLPDKGYLNNVNEVLSSSALDYLVDPKVQEVIATRLNNGDNINAILKDLWNVVQSARNIVGKANEVTVSARQSMDQVNQTMATIDGYKASANGLVLILFLIMIGVMALILYKRANLILPIVMSGLLSALFIILGIMTTVVNNKINVQLANMASQINNEIVEIIRSILTGTFGNIGGFIANYIGEQANFLLMAFNLQLEVGYWVILLSLLGCFVILIIAKRYENKNSQSDNHLITATEAVEDEGVEGKKPAASLATESVISNT